MLIRKKIKIINLIFEGFIENSNISPKEYITSVALAKSINLTPQTAHPMGLPKQLKAMLGKERMPRKMSYINSKNKISNIMVWDINNIGVYYNYHFIHGNKSAGLFIEEVKVNHWFNETLSTSKEKTVQLKLCERVSGKMEIDTPVGKIDILTPTHLIEIKDIKNWKGAMGQVLAYGAFYPSHEKRIHLFGETQESYLNMIQQICEPYKIVVTWEP